MVKSCSITFFNIHVAACVIILEHPVLYIPRAFPLSAIYVAVQSRRGRLFLAPRCHFHIDWSKTKERGESCFVSRYLIMPDREGKKRRSLSPLQKQSAWTSDRKRRGKQKLEIHVKRTRAIEHRCCSTFLRKQSPVAGARQFLLRQREYEAFALKGLNRRECGLG